GVKIRSYSSYNPTGRTFRDFRNYTLENEDGFEMANYASGDGMLVGMWFTSLERGDVRFGPGLFGDIKLYLSDPRFPDFIKQREMFFSQNIFPNLQPLWGTAGGAQWAFPCLPFSGLFKAYSTEAPHWYQFTCHLYREARFSEAVSTDELKKANDWLASHPPGSYPGKSTGFRQQSGGQLLQAGQALRMFEAEEAGVIRTVYLRLPPGGGNIADSLWVRLFTDGEQTACVPLSIFFGGYPGAPMSNAKGLPCGFDGERFYFFFPIPFWENCQVEIENRSAEAAVLEYEVQWSDANDYPRDNTGTFHIRYNDGITRKAGEPDFPHLQVRGTGHIAGATANLAGSIEGNFRIYVDDAHTPAIETTGGEDYFCHAFGIDVGLLTPFHGGLNDKIGYRFHIASYIPFQRSVFFGQDHGHAYSHDTDGTFRSAVFYYLNPEPSLVPTDSLDVGNATDEKAHHFSISGSRTQLQTDTAAYEGNFNTPFSDDGRWTNGEMVFTMKLAADNDGLRLRRRINQLSFHQETEVWVDGQKVGTWFEKGSNYQLLREPHPGKHPEYNPDWHSIPNRFRDTEFEIPARFTKSKTSIELVLKTTGAMAAIDPQDEGLTNAYFFWVYSYR
ncbi:MAG: DUF2961 domain-containing protein, partial [Saprospiraceae bacterium]